MQRLQQAHRGVVVRDDAVLYFDWFGGHVEWLRVQTTVQDWFFRAAHD